jgi:hypothetical protein
MFVNKHEGKSFSKEICGFSAGQDPHDMYKYSIAFFSYKWEEINTKININEA